VSAENVEIVRRAYEAASRGDWDAAFESFDAEVEWEETPGLGPDASAYRGIEQVQAAIQSWVGMWNDYEIQVHDYVDAGDQVLLLARESGHGRASGVSAERELGEVFTLRDRTVVRVCLYGSWREAREAAGLRE
jgi:ketosteroid isomerase-like protein